MEPNYREKIATTTKIVILQTHPHDDIRHKVATVPALARCLDNCEIVYGNQLRRNVSPLLDSLYSYAVSDPDYARPVLFLFPGSETIPAVDIEEWKTLHADDDDPVLSDPVLIAFDATWKTAKEMVEASLPFITKFATQVSLDGESVFSSELAHRRAPFNKCMSTMEAVARCLRVIEPNGAEIESRLIEVLRGKVRSQASSLEPMKPRVKLSKKSKAAGV